eukprot:7643054-Ditylum_brightwellii.AAC.1
MEILRLQITSSTKTIQTVQEFTTVVNFSMKKSLNTDEYSSFDCNTGWHKRLVEYFMMKHNLKFAKKEYHKGNHLRTLCTKEKNTAIKNKNWQMKDFIGMFINITKPKDEDTGKDRTKEVWNDYFIKWVGQDKGVTLENIRSTVRDGKWNIDSSTRKKIYNEKSIKVSCEKVETMDGTII